MIDPVTRALLPSTAHSEARAAVAYVLLAEARAIIVCHCNHCIRDEFDAAVELAQKMAPTHIADIRRDHSDARIAFKSGGEIRCVTPHLLHRLRGATWGLLLEATETRPPRPQRII
ncbi:hypothetical protein QNA23_10825 [Rhodococcus erythropolis]|uniref:hypothetical protein n=1 Tax=Rhodococcus erythropolis TaxID=1833 RepID=UPI0024B96E39|nr:hypothetical protein [Rhodococcus erythropolis]MDJ0403976.1 hypothetical protein [Rhodococcus erythropolis]